eukprot:GHVP01014120.1.p1 GENE.GHVP01014120.1~~GHVP01014120.1.p1  ORF type:complete len:214 (+),score=38.17 GHVP01014120.1:2-643(+)
MTDKDEKWYKLLEGASFKYFDDISTSFSDLPALVDEQIARRRKGSLDLGYLGFGENTAFAEFSSNMADIQEKAERLRSRVENMQNIQNKKTITENTLSVYKKIEEYTVEPEKSVIELFKRKRGRPKKEPKVEGVKMLEYGSRIDTNKCPYCERTFQRNHDLLRHVRIHEGVKPFSCELCGKGFSRKDSIKRHIDTHRKRGEANISSEKDLNEL